MVGHVGLEMASLRDIHWDILLVQYLEPWGVLLMVSPLMDYKARIEISNLRDLDLDHHWEKKLEIHWCIILVQDLELWEVLEVILIADQMDNFFRGI